MRLGLTTFIGLITATLIGCSTMSKDECLTADWRAIGFEDGSRGSLVTRFGQRREACAKHGVQADLDQYRQGHAEGVPNYCVPRNGFALGKRGGTYSSLCPSEQYPKFEDAYTIGLRVHEIQLEINDLEGQYKDKEAELDDLNSRIANNEEQIIADGTLPETRRDLMTQNKELEMIAESLGAELSALDHDILSLKRRRDAIRY